MPTLEELQAQIESLKQQVDAITAPPDEYYTLQYSGEEVDQRLSDEGDGTVKTVAGVSPDETGNVPITAENIKAALAGYGLGEYARVAGTDLNNNVLGGWYVFFSSAQNSPFASGKLLVIPYSSNLNYTTQIAFSTDAYRSIAVRSCSNGSWYPWEYINPPMQLGVEYRTTDRWNGKPVYAKYVNFGNGPNTTTKSVAHDIENFSQCAGWNGILSGENLQGHSGIVSVNINATNITIVTDQDFSGRPIYVAIKYTKTTD